MNQTVCILYGINEGPAMGKQLSKALASEGFALVHDPKSADIIIAHSGGCFLVPKAQRAKLVLLIGMPYWPKRSWVVCTSRKVGREWRLYKQQGRLLQWAHKWGNHLRYSLDLKGTILMAVNRSANKSWNSHNHQVIIRNKNDTYCAPGIVEAPFKGPRTFISLPGEHDDCWDNPKPYMDLIQLLYTHK
jgi:hypothetical protein